jgi:hypothetical protein
MKYIVNFTWDDEANVWIATGENIPGLVLEDSSYDLLAKRVTDAIPELLELNHMPMTGTVCLRSEQYRKVMYNG